MNEYLKTELLDGEEILWEGKSEDFKILSGPWAQTLPKVWAISGIVLAAFAIWYVTFVIKTGFSVSQFLITAVLVGLVPLSLCFHSVSDYKIIRKELTYVLTNYRAIVLRGREEKHMQIDENTAYTVESVGDGVDAIFIGDACKFKIGKSREKAVLGIYGDEQNQAKVTGMVFYGVKNGEEICKKHAVFAK